MNIKAFLLHHANRSVKDFSFGQYLVDFYRVKDAILRKYGKPDGYDIQHIEGKQCYKCRGTGRYDRWDNYGIYDPDTCWGCAGTGWYRDPQWNCLERFLFGPYTFHRPISRKYGINPPALWEVNDRQIIKGYVEHRSTWFGRYALALIMFGTPDFKLIVKRILKEWRWYWERKIGRLKIIFKSNRQPAYYINDPDSDLPF